MAVTSHCALDLPFQNPQPTNNAVWAKDKAEQKPLILLIQLGDGRGGLEEGCRFVDMSEC